MCLNLILACMLLLFSTGHVGIHLFFFYMHIGVAVSKYPSRYYSSVPIGPAGVNKAEWSLICAF